jgi:hypothetical protein
VYIPSDPMNDRPELRTASTGMNREIQNAVEKTVGGPVDYLHSSLVIEASNGKTIWKGMVEVFKVENPPPLIAYGWAVKGQNGTDYVAVLGTSPTDSPVAAVRAWALSQAKRSQP